MTGTGTQSDPFIAETWDEFCLAVSESSSYYVELGADINLNDVAPSGITRTVNISCRSINGRGHRIHGLTAEGINAFYMNPSNGCTITDLHFTDIYLIGSHFFNYPFERGVKFSSCTFAGRIHGTDSGMFEGERSIRDISFSRCAFSFDTVGNVRTLSGYYYGTIYAPVLSDCNVYVNALDYNGMAYQTFNAYDTQITGSFANGLDVWGARSAVNADVLSGTVSGGSGNIINSDKIAQGVAVNGITQVTEAQMKNAEYLASIGFPIGVA